MQKVRHTSPARLTLPLLLAALGLGVSHLQGGVIPIPVADFNTPNVPLPPANSWCVLPNGTTFGSGSQWTVTGGTIDLLRVPDYQTPDGKQGVDLDGDNVGQISTTLNIPVAGDVTIDFYLSGCPLPPPDVKLMRMSLGSAYRDFSFDYTTHGWFEWLSESATFSGQLAGPVTLTFTSLDGNLGDQAYYGPYISGVRASVSSVPDGGLTIVLLGIAAGGLSCFRRGIRD